MVVVEALRRVSWIRFPPEPSVGLPSHVNLLNAAVTIFSSLPPSLPHAHRRNGHVTLTLARVLPLSCESQPAHQNALSYASCIA